MIKDVLVSLVPLNYILQKITFDSRFLIAVEAYPMVSTGPHVISPFSDRDHNDNEEREVENEEVQADLDYVQDPHEPRNPTTMTNDDIEDLVELILTPSRDRKGKQNPFTEEEVRAFLQGLVEHDGGCWNFKSVIYAGKDGKADTVFKRAGRRKNCIKDKLKSCKRVGLILYDAEKKRHYWPKTAAERKYFRP